MRNRYQWLMGLVMVLMILMSSLTTTNGDSKPAKTIGILQMTPVLDMSVEAFKKRLQDLGYREGKTVRYIYKNAHGSIPQLRAYADEFVAMDVDLIFTLTSPATAAAQAATAQHKIPIVFTAVMFPQEAGFIDRVERPGGWITGTSPLILASKQLEVFAQAVPSMHTLGILYTAGDHSEVIKQLLQAIHARNLSVQTASVRSPADVAGAVASLLPNVDALYIPADNIVTTQIDTIIQATRQHHIPVMAPTESAVKQGALVSYIADYQDLAAFTAEMAHKIFQGENPAEMPVEYPVNPKLSLNLQTSRAIGVTIPTTLIFLADSVIE